MNDVKITRHREPPPTYSHQFNLGHVKAEGGGAAVTLPVSLELLDDDEALQHYIDHRLLPFHQMELERR